MMKSLPQTRNLMLAIALGCIAALCVAMYLQHVMGMLPCPLCVIQRYLFLAVAVLCLIGVATRMPKLWGGLALLGAIGGAGVAGRHVYILAHPGLSCGIDPLQTALNKVFTAEYLPFLFQANGMCEDALAPVLGLSIPQWSLVSFSLCVLGLLVALIRRP